MNGRGDGKDALAVGPDALLQVQAEHLDVTVVTKVSAGVEDHDRRLLNAQQTFKPPKRQKKKTHGDALGRLDKRV